MRFQKIAMALLACLALGGFAASNAQAAEGDGWTIGTTENQVTAGTLIPNGFFETVTCKKHGTTPLVFTANLFGAAVELSATGVTCAGVRIDNTVSKGHSSGALKFTGVTVVKPSKCSIHGGAIATEELTDEVIMDPTAGSTAVFDRFFPQVAGGNITAVLFEGTECVLAGDEAALKGSVCGESVRTNAAGNGFEPNKTGTLTKVQTLLFGEAQQKTANTAAKPCALTFGVKPAQISGAVDFELSGNNKGAPFGVD